jgi:hypothetical protein
MISENVRGWRGRWLNKVHAEEMKAARAAIRAARYAAAQEAAAKQEAGEVEPAPVEVKPAPKIAAPPVEPSTAEMVADLTAAGYEVPETTAPARVKELHAKKAKK